MTNLMDKPNQSRELNIDYGKVMIIKKQCFFNEQVNAAGNLLFFRQREGSWCPTLKLLHQYPFTMSTQDIAAKNKGIGVENYHYLNDGLWNMKPVKS